MAYKHRISLIALMVAALIAIAAGKASAIVIDKIIAVVNGEVITQREVARYLLPVYEQYSKEYTGSRLERKMAEAEEGILDQLIDDKLILSEARNQSIEATQEEIDEKLSAFKTRFETEEEFRKSLARQNISFSELTKIVESDIIKAKLVRRSLGWKVSSTPSEIKKYYDDHLGRFTVPAKVKAFNIVVKKGRQDRSESDSKFLINKIKESLGSGHSFEELAREYSESPNGKKGGSLGYIERGEMIDIIDETLFSLVPGQTSDIVESPIGFHIFRVTERVEAKVTDFESARFEIEDILHKEKVDGHIKDWLKGLRKNAYISIKN